MAVGTLLIAWPGVTQTVFRDSAFAGHEEALMRVIGLTVAVIGWLYIFGGRSGARQFVAASVVDRLVFVPLVLIPLAIAGVFLPPLHYIHAAGRIPRHRGVGPACSRMNVRKGSLADIAATMKRVRFCAISGRGPHHRAGNRKVIPSRPPKPWGPVSGKSIQ